MRYRSAVAYVVLAILTVLSYATVRSTVIAQGPTDTHIVVSNLTLNYVLFVLLVGAFIPSVTRRLFPRAYKRMFVPVALIVGAVLIVVLRALGVEMKF